MEKNYNWCPSIRGMLEKLVKEYNLPDGSLLMSDNKAQKEPERIISHTVYIYEPDYPFDIYLPEQNMIVLTIFPSTAKSRPDDLDIGINDDQFEDIKEMIPKDATILEQTKTDISTASRRIRFNKSSESMVDFIKQNVIYAIEHYQSKSSKFGCCAKYKECSKVGKCLHDNLLYSKACIYRSNLEAGKIFY